MRLQRLAGLALAPSVTLLLLLSTYSLLAQTTSVTGGGAHEFPAAFTRVAPATTYNTDSLFADISANGDLVVFQSDGDFWHEDIENNDDNIWLYDVTGLTLTRVTTDAGGSRDSYRPVLSADGSALVFESDWDYLDEGIPDQQFNVWWYDTAGGTYRRLTDSSDGTFDRDAFDPDVNGDGSLVVFESDSDLLELGLPDSEFQVYLFDLATLTHTLITSPTHPDVDSTDARISADGRRIVFESDGNFLEENVADNSFNIWLYDRATLAFTRLTTDTDGLRDSFNPSISADGRYVVFESDAELLGSSIVDNDFQIFLYEVANGALRQVTQAVEPGRDNFDAEISGDGEWIIWDGDDDLLGQGTQDDEFNVFLYQIASGSLTQLTTSSDGTEARDSEHPALSADGRRALFYSDSDLVGAGVPDDQYEIYVADLEIPAIIVSNTVGTEIGTCAPGNEAIVSTEAPVYFCYTVHNSGSYTLTVQSISDTLGTDEVLTMTLPPGATINTVDDLGLSITHMAAADFSNRVVWTASSGDTVARAAATVHVRVQAPTDVALTGVSGGGGKPLTGGRGWPFVDMLGVALLAAGGVFWRRRTGR